MKPIRIEIQFRCDRNGLVEHPCNASVLVDLENPADLKVLRWTDGHVTYFDDSTLTGANREDLYAAVAKECKELLSFAKGLS